MGHGGASMHGCSWPALAVVACAVVVLRAAGRPPLASWPCKQPTQPGRPSEVATEARRTTVRGQLPVNVSSFACPSQSGRPPRGAALACLGGLLCMRGQSLS
jgi:hypothetical protein